MFVHPSLKTIIGLAYGDLLSTKTNGSSFGKPVIIEITRSVIKLLSYDSHPHTSKNVRKNGDLFVNKSHAS